MKLPHKSEKILTENKFWQFKIDTDIVEKYLLKYTVGFLCRLICILPEKKLLRPAVITVDDIEIVTEI